MRFVDRFGIWLIMLAGAVVRLWNLGYPHKLVFDETYYVKDAWTLSSAGHELSWPSNPDAAFEAGHANGFLNVPSYVVHPPLGKWLIALGMRAFGAENSFGWRISVAVFGIWLIWLLYVVASRVLASKRWGLFVAALLALDGEAIVMSRTGLLDTFLACFALLAFYYLLRDLESGVSSLWRRPWLLAMGATLGAASAVKWSGIYFLAAFALYAVGRHIVENRSFSAGLKKAVATFVLTVPVALVTYLASWTGWFVTHGYGYDAKNPLLAFWNYHREMYSFHVGLHAYHPYQANPLTWLFMVRPTSFFYESCGMGCSTGITAIGNPLVWWLGAIAVITVFLGWLTKRDRLSGLVLLGLAGGYLPWLAYTERTVFEFYVIAFEPWILLAIGLMLKRFIEQSERKVLMRRLCIGYLVAVAAVAVYFLPIWLGTPVPYSYWIRHIWLPSWL